MTKPNANETSGANGKRRKPKKAQSARLRDCERVVRRFILNQPSASLGMHPGWFRNTFSGQEHEQLRANILLWRRGRVLFEDSDDMMPVCKSSDGLKPSPLIEAPKSGACGQWNGNDWFTAECPMAAWRFYNGRRCAPLCQETWSFLGVLEDDGNPFWISLKGTSLRSARKFLSMCYEVTKAGKQDLLDCCITLSAELAHGRTFDYCVVSFSQPKWIARKDAKHRKLKRMLLRFGQADIQATFDAEQSDAPIPAMAG